MDAARARKLLSQTVGPAPWYWQTFPKFQSHSRQQFVWTHHGTEGPVAHLVTLGLRQETGTVRLALNTYCRPFLAPSNSLGIWCPEGRNLRITCFDPGNMKSFDFAEIAGWFPASSERIYAATAPLCDFELPVNLADGMHNLEVPPELREVDELIVPTTYPEQSPDDPAMALFVVYFQAGLVEVLPQRWFTAAQYQVGRQWITRVARDKQSHRIFGECFGAGSFLLEEDGVRLERWIDKG